ncbi:MAG TPA: hypothetical protein DCY94_01660 [Firmicutes bacterium]|nr:hypothetical protein [Bacillota bacterium]
MGDYLIYYGITIVTIIITVAAQCFINGTYSKFKRVENRKKMSGSEAARMILDANNLSDIYVVETRGELTDHYDPNRKVIRLSSDVFHKESVASVAVAAHECGHAIQDKENYRFLRIRSFLVPIVNLASYAGYIAIFVGIITSMLNIVWLGIIMEAMILVFQLVTLPVEFDASKRAMEEVKKLSILDDGELDGGKKVLTSAALTYVAAVATAILELLRLILIYGRDRD